MADFLRRPWFVFGALFFAIAAVVSVTYGLLGGPFFLVIGALCFFADRGRWASASSNRARTGITVGSVIGATLVATAAFSAFDMALPTRSHAALMTERFIDVQHRRGGTDHYKAVRIQEADGDKETLREETLWDEMVDAVPKPAQVRTTLILGRITRVSVGEHSYDVKWRNQGPGSETLLFPRARRHFSGVCRCSWIAGTAKAAAKQKA